MMHDMYHYLLTYMSFLEFISLNSVFLLNHLLLFDAENSSVKTKTCILKCNCVQWPTEGGGCSNPPPEIPNALQNRAKLNPIVKTVKKLLNLGCQHTKMFGKKAVKF